MTMVVFRASDGPGFLPQQLGWCSLLCRAEVVQVQHLLPQVGQPPHGSSMAGLPEQWWTPRALTIAVVIATAIENQVTAPELVVGERRTNVLSRAHTPGHCARTQ